MTSFSFTTVECFVEAKPLSLRGGDDFLKLLFSPVAVCLLKLILKL